MFTTLAVRKRHLWPLFNLLLVCPQMRFAFVVLITLLLSPIAYSQPCLLAAKVVEPVLSAETRELYEKNLEDAEAVHLDKPNEADSIIWLGRRMAYLGRYKDAVRVFSSGFVLFKNDARF